MNARFPICLIALVIALPLAVAGCGNSGSLVMPDAPEPVPSEADVGIEAQDTNADEVDTTVDDSIEELGADPIPAVSGDEAGND